MSLLEEIWADGPSGEADVGSALSHLCSALLAENRLQPAAVVAARIRVPAGVEFPTGVPRELGWTRIPVFWEHTEPGASLEVVAHVRVKRRRRLRPVHLSSHPSQQEMQEPPA